MEFHTLSTALFFATAAALLLLEWLSPWRRTANQVQHRWLTNIGLMLLGGLLVTIVFPVSAQDIAADMEGGWLRQLPLPLEALLLFMLLDCWRYWEHRVFHEVPLLWRAHLVHHSDTSLDITTGQRHHPLEALIATCTTLLLVFALGFSAQALVIYIGVATLSALWTHANINLPESIDRPLRLWLVTPAAHAVHHSALQPETDSNYGTVLTLWDRLFGTYIDPVAAHIPHFGLDYFHRREDSPLAAVLLQPFDYRRGMAYPARTPINDEPAATPIALSGAWQQALRQLFLGLGLALLALWPTALSLAEIWSNSEAYQYAWLVLPMFVYVVGWYHRERILAMTPRPDAIGLLVILCAIIGWYASALVDIKLGQHLALVLVLQGIALCALGRDVYRKIFPMMAMLFLMLPCGDILQPLLRELTVKWIEWFAVALNLPHTVDGFMIYVGEHRYVVVDACSGLTFVTLAGFLGYSFGLLLFGSFRKILAMAILGAAMGVFTNALRVWLIVGIDWLRGSQMDMAAHMDLQWLALLSSLGLLFFFTVRLAGEDTEPSGQPAPATTFEPPWRVARFAPLLAGVLVLLLVIPAQRLVAQRVNSVTDPLQIVADFYPGSSWLYQQTKEGSALLIPHNQQLEIIIVEPDKSQGRVDESLLEPDGDLLWRHTATGRYRDCADTLCAEFMHKTWRLKGSNNVRHALYTYYVGDRTTDSELSYRLASGWNRLSGAGAASGLIGFRVRGELPTEHVIAGVFQRLRAELHSAQYSPREINTSAVSSAILAGTGSIP